MGCVVVVLVGGVLGVIIVLGDFGKRIGIEQYEIKGISVWLCDSSR